MGLTALEIERAKAGSKLYRLYDGDGLFIEITPTGSKRWRVKYYLNGRERRLSLGLYPELSLAQARGRQRTLRGQVADGIDPALARTSERGYSNLQCAISAGVRPAYP